MRHQKGFIYPSFDEHDQYAVKAVTGYDHGPVEAAMHYGLIVLQVQAGFFVTLAIGWRMAVEALVPEYWIDIVTKG
jgi:hypothetical protein